MVCEEEATPSAGEVAFGGGTGRVHRVPVCGNLVGGISFFIFLRKFYFLFSLTPIVTGLEQWLELVYQVYLITEDLKSQTIRNFRNHWRSWSS